MKTEHTGLSGFESFVPPNSSLIGKKVQEIESACGVVFDHAHNSPPEVETRIERGDALLQTPLTIGMGLHVWGKSASLRAFIKLLNNPAVAQ
jgi:hypothetical protein